MIVQFRLPFLFLTIYLVTILLICTPSVHTAKVKITNPSAITASDSVLFAADNRVTLYVNGVKKYTTTHWVRFAEVAVGTLKTGDVIAFQARDWGGYWGLISIINAKALSSSLYSGVDEMQTVNAVNLPASERTTWYTRNYAGVCAVGSKWRPAIVRTASPKWIPGQARWLPASPARYVWAPDAGEHDTIYARVRIGGENCDAALKDRATITFTADNEVELFINGFLVDWNTDWRVVASEAVDLRNGDVIAMRARDFGDGYGAVAAVRFANGNLLVTGGTYDAEWRGLEAFAIEADPNAWMYKTYNDCNWPAVNGLGNDPKVTGIARAFPLAATKAEYVWAKDVVGKKTVFLRAVVGGRDCQPEV